MIRLEWHCALEKNLKWFKETGFCTYSKHAPIKRKYVLANEATFMTKELHQPIMKRSRLRNKFLKTKSITDRKNYDFQWNCCKKLLRYTKKLYFNNLDISKINDNRSFWKTIVPLFSKKTQKGKILSWMKKVKMSQTMLNCVVFSITIFQKSFPIWKYQVW